MGFDWKGEIEKVRMMIVGGDLDAAEKRVQELASRRTIPRAHALDLASRARQAGLPAISLRLLGRYVRDGGRKVARPTDKELAEYGAALTELGAVHEAVEVFSRIDAERQSDMLLLRAFALEEIWAHRRSIEDLRRYAQAVSGFGRHPRAVAAMHLGAVLLRSGARGEEPARLLREALELVPPKAEFIRQRSSLHLMHHAVLDGRLEEAEEWAARIEREFGDRLHATLFFRQLKALIELARDPRAPEDSRCRRELRHVRDRFAELGHPEAGRYCMLLEALFRGERELLLKLYFGSPYPELRERLVEVLGGERNIPESFDLYLTPQAKGGDPVVIDVLSGENSVSDRRLKTGQLVQRILEILGTDGFRGYRQVELFDRAFPGEHYNPASSPLKLYQGVGRLREWFEECGLPVTVECVNGFYHLRASKPCVLRISRVEKLETPRVALLTDYALSELMKKLSALKDPEKGVSTPEAASLLATSERSAVRHLKAACENGLLERVGKGKRTRYRLKAA